MSATIYDIAEKAGVSACWVSFVLRDHPRAKEVSPAMRDRIKAAAAELHYHRNLSAATISGGFNRSTIAMVVPDTWKMRKYSYMNTRYFHAIRYFNENGYGVRIYCENDDLENTFQEILSNQIRYVFVNLYDREKRDLCAEICRKNKLMAAFRGCHLPPYPDFPSFESDEKAILASLTEYLVKLGHKRIGAVLGTLCSPGNQMRYQAWRAAMKKYGLPDDPELCMHVHGFSDDALLRLLREQRPTALFAADHSMATRILHFCAFYRIPVPEAFSLVSFDTQPSPPFYTHLSVTGVEEESIMEDIDKACLAYFRGRRKRSAFFSGRIVPGESTAAPSGDFSWLKRLPETLDNDRKWFPDNRFFELEEEKMRLTEDKKTRPSKGGAHHV